MKEIRSKKGSKQIICIIVVLMLCNFIVPNYSYAAETNGGGTLFDPVIKFITFLCDSVMQFMQNSFTSNQSIANGDGTFNFQYSPAIIFSGTVQGLDINFITPNTDVRNTNNYEAFLRTKAKQEYSNETQYADTKISENDYENYLENAKLHEGAKTIPDINESGLLSSTKATMVYYEEIREEVYEENGNKVIEEKRFLIVEYFSKFVGQTVGILPDIKEWNYVKHEYEITPRFIDEMNATATYTSIASELQPTIATWYNALRRIALVGLLSVLVYLGIRVVLSSSSPEGNSKYKKMLTDWLIALCLLFTLHYIMSATLVITKKLSAIFSTGETDVLLNTLRYNIEDSKTWGVALSQAIMYVVLVIYTGVFTFQYLKRVLYMAFFTMIAPLITLTYPLDKVSDGQAQAFNMWIREYIFNALIQVIHLIVYFTIVGSAMELVTSFPLYGIIAIGFLTQAEKIIRSMFGFNNAETVGTMGAVAAGGLVATAMNKLKSLPKGAKGGKTGNSSSGGGSNSNVRTATKNPLSGEKENSGGTNPTGNPKEGTGKEKTKFQKKMEEFKNKPEIKGAMRVGKKAFSLGAKGVLGTGLGLTGGIIGFAAGVAQGDAGAALGGAMAGGAAGMNLGKRAVDLPGNISNGVKNGWNNIKDTYREGAYGEEAAQAIKFDEEFRKGSTYKALQSNSNFSEESVQAMLDSGITDKKAMTAILDSGENIETAIEGYQAVKNCPDEIFYSPEGFNVFCTNLKSMPGVFNGMDTKEISKILKKFK